ncbi:MAG: hypothetical protein ACI9HK_004361, partial [Pirellulaceae bacterium]
TLSRSNSIPKQLYPEATLSRSNSIPKQLYPEATCPLTVRLAIGTLFEKLTLRRIDSQFWPTSL